MLKVEFFFNGLYFKKKWKNVVVLVFSLVLVELFFFENGFFMKIVFIEKLKF